VPQAVEDLVGTAVGTQEGFGSDGYGRIILTASDATDLLPKIRTKLNMISYMEKGNKECQRASTAKQRSSLHCSR
jgi:hypothetical protein